MSCYPCIGGLRLWRFEGADILSDLHVGTCILTYHLTAHIISNYGTKIICSETEVKEKSYGD